MLRKLIPFLLPLCLCWLPQVQAQQQEPLHRPKIGLVLSGGGAKGMAHIGFLKVLEEAGIRPDYITGTSMGSLVGALYALGYSASDIEKIALEQDWEMLLSNQVPLSQIAFEEKEYYGRYLLELPVEDLKIGFPSGLIEGQALNNLLIRLTRGAHGIQQFDQLPIPYACVATDIATGQKVVLREGFLPEAMRASMAIPTVFTPVKVNDKLLVDGGLVQNFPVQEVLDMGADFVIGVNVGGGLEPEQNLKSMIDVLVQATFFTSAANLESEKKKTDLLVDILPSLEGYTTGSFNKTRDIIKIGEEVARQYTDSLRSLSAYFSSFPEPMYEPRTHHLQDSLQIHKIILSGGSTMPSRILRRRLRLQERQATTIGTLEQRIEVLYGTGHFNRVSYAMVPADSGRHHLQVNVEEAPAGVLKTAIYYDSENRAGATINYTHRNLLWEGSRFVAEVDLGQNIRSDVNYLKYMGYRHQLAAKAGSHYYKTDLSLFDGRGNKIAILQQNTNVGLVGWQTTTNNTWSLGQQLEYRLARLYPQVAGQVILDSLVMDMSELEQVKVRNWGLSTFFRLNSLNRHSYPTRGWRTDLQASFLFGNKQSVRTNENRPELKESLDNSHITPYLRLSLQTSGVVPLHPKLSLMLRQGLYFYTSSDLAIGAETMVGGYTSVLPNMLEYRATEPFAYSTDNLFYSGLGLQLQLRHKLYLQASSTLLNTSLLHGSRTLRGKDTRIGYSATLGYLTPFGPITVGTAREHSTDWRGFISLGFRVPW